MKKTVRLMCLVLLPVVVLIACASRPGMAAGRGHPLPSELPPPHLERLIQRIQRNGADMMKYFTLDNDGQILVKADLRDAAGDFEVIYQLEEARALGNAAYEVRFSARNKETGERFEDTLVWRPAAGRAGILLSFDDRFLDSWERHFDLFDAYGASVTFFYQGDFDPSFSARAASRGHDIGYHSITHPDLRGVSRETFARETIEPASAFRQAGFSLPSFAYPFGRFEPWMHEMLLGHYSILRGFGTTFNLYTAEQLRRGYISSRSIDNTMIPEEDQFDRLIRSMLRTTQFLDAGWVLPLTSHDISDSAWAISPRRLEFLLKTAVELGLHFYRYSDFAAL